MKNNFAVCKICCTVNLLQSSRQYSKKNSYVCFRYSIATWNNYLLHSDYFKPVPEKLKFTISLSEAACWLLEDIYILFHSSSAWNLEKVPWSSRSIGGKHLFLLNWTVCSSRKTCLRLKAALQTRTGLQCWVTSTSQRVGGSDYSYGMIWS